MKIFTPLSIAMRVVVYSAMLFGAAELIRLDALFPMEDGYYGEISFTELSQEAILLILIVLYMLAGQKCREIKPVTNLLSLVFMASFIRELNFLISGWFYLVLALIITGIWFLIRDFRKLKPATSAFFALPASGWFFSGFLITFLFSRLMGRSSFWRILYDQDSYRIAKAATEEGMELAGYVMMLISAIELFIIIGHLKGKEQQ